MKMNDGEMETVCLWWWGEVVGGGCFQSLNTRFQRTTVHCSRRHRHYCLHRYAVGVKQFFFFYLSFFLVVEENIVGWNILPCGDSVFLITTVGMSVARIGKVVFSLNESLSGDSNTRSHPYYGDCSLLISSTNYSLVNHVKLYIGAWLDFEEYIWWISLVICEKIIISLEKIDVILREVFFWSNYIKNFRTS